jgi:FkbM family methyltransferase
MKQRIIYAILFVIGLFTKKFLGKHTIALLVKSDNCLFAVDPEDSSIGLHLRRKGEYGTAEINKLKQYISKNNSKVLIVGAHIGTIAIPISNICNEVIAIEANPNTYKLLEINIKLNAVANCRPINIAASDKEENIEFLLNRINSGGSKRIPKIRKYMYYYDNPEKITVHAVALDDYLEENQFDLVVMDIEGSEYFALKGMRRILENSKVLAVEFLPHHLRNISGVTVKQFLSVLPNYQFLTIPSTGVKVDSTRFLSTLNEMYDHELEDEGIIFEKA